MTVHRFVNHSYEETAGKTDALWQALLPVELQCIIAQHAVHSEPDGTVDYRTSANLRLVNHAWRASVDPELFQDVVIKSERHFLPLLGIDGHLTKREGPARFVKRLRIDWFPDRNCENVGPAGLKVDEFHHDISFMRQDLEETVNLESRFRLLEVVHRCVPL